ncbi:hypothetical protein C8J56DRAFT_275536 [Mycena floridula]|nr:hypothetical protein C8J56DRAFT_275536 [Mycena floridula]
MARHFNLVSQAWTTIKVGFQPTADIPMLSSMLARSHAKALDISIGPAGESSFQTLLPSSSRWRTLHLVELEQIALLQPARGHLDSLTELCIRFPDTEQIHQNGPLNIFDVAPLLQKVELIYEHDQEYPEVFLPWPTITELTAKSLYRLYISLAVLPLCKNLVFASIDELDCDGANSILAIMSLPRLTNLHLHASQPVAIALFLDKLAAPTLKSLHLKTLGPCLADEEIDSVTSLVERDGCSLTDIQFRNMRFTPLQFTGFLASSPNITRFVSDNDCGDKNYDDNDDDESITSLLTLSPGDSDVLSKLTHLGLVDVDETGIGELLDMIESRPELISVILHTDEELDEPESYRIEALRAKGLTLLILDEPVSRDF